MRMSELSGQRRFSKARNSKPLPHSYCIARSKTSWSLVRRKGSGFIVFRFRIPSGAVADFLGAVACELSYQETKMRGPICRSGLVLLVPASMKVQMGWPIACQPRAPIFRRKLPRDRRVAGFGRRALPDISAPGPACNVVRADTGPSIHAPVGPSDF